MVKQKALFASGPSKPHWEEVAGRSGGALTAAFLWLGVIALATTGGYVRDPFSGELLLNVLIAIAVPTLVSCRLLRWIPRSKYRLRNVWPLALWLGVAIAGLLWAPDRQRALTYIVYMLVRLSLILVTAVLILDQRDGRFTSALALLAMAVVPFNIGVSVWEYATHSHFHLSGTLAMAAYKQAWPTAFQRNPNDLCLMLVLYLPFITVLSRHHSKDGRARNLIEVISISGAVVVIWVCTAAQSRAILLLALFQFGWLLFSGIRNRLLGALGLIVVVLMLIPFVHDQWPYYSVDGSESLGTRERLRPGEESSGPVEASDQTVRRAVNLREAAEALRTEFSLEGRSGSERLELLRIGADLLMKSGGMGVGPGNSELLVERYKTRGRTDLHNWWMELVVDYGVIGFLAFGGFFLWLCISLGHRWKVLSPGKEAYLAEASIISLLSFAPGSMAPSSIAAQHYPWMIFGLALALVSAPGSPAFGVSYRKAGWSR